MASTARRVLFFKRARTPCQRKTHCAEVRSVTAAPPRFLGPRFRGGNERGGNPDIVPAECPLRWGPHCDSSHTAAPQPLAFLPLVFSANAGTQGTPSIGRQPKGHRTTTASAARRVLFFKRARTPCRRKTHCTEVRSMTATPPRLLGPCFRRGNEKDENPDIAPAERSLH